MLHPPPESNESVKEASAWSQYISQYAQSNKGEEFLHKIGNNKAVYLVRNKRRNVHWIDFKTDQENREKSIKEEEEDDEEMEEDEEKEEIEKNDDDYKTSISNVTEENDHTVQGRSTIC